MKILFVFFIFVLISCSYNHDDINNNDAYNFEIEKLKQQYDTTTILFTEKKIKYLLKFNFNDEAFVLVNRYLDTCSSNCSVIINYWNVLFRFSNNLDSLNYYINHTLNMAESNISNNKNVNESIGAKYFINHYFVDQSYAKEFSDSVKTFYNKNVMVEYNLFLADNPKDSILVDYKFKKK